MAVIGPPLPEYIPNLDKCVITRNNITMYITDVYTGKATTRTSHNRGGVVVTRLSRESDWELYKRATDVAAAAAIALRG